MTRVVAFSLILAMAAAVSGCVDCGRRKNNPRKAARGAGEKTDGMRPAPGSAGARLRTMMAQVPADAAAAVAVVNLARIPDAVEWLTAGTVTCPALGKPGSRSAKHGRMLAGLLQSAPGALSAAGVKLERGGVLYLRKCSSSGPWTITWRVAVAKAVRYVRAARRALADPQVRNGIAIFWPAAKRGLNAKCEPDGQGAVECRAIIGASGKTDCPPQAGATLLPPLKLTASPEFRPEAAFYLRARKLVPASTLAWTASRWPGRPPDAAWVMLGGKPAARSVPGKTEASFKKLNARIWLPDARFNLIGDGPAPRAGLGTGAPLQLRSYLAVQANLPRLAAWLSAHHAAIRNVLSWVRGQGADLRQLIFKSLTGRFVVASTSEGPVATAELQPEGPGPRLVRRLDLLAASAVGVADAVKRNRLLTTDTGKAGKLGPAPTDPTDHVEVAFSRVVVSGAPASHARFLLPARTLEPVEVRPLLRTVGLFWAQRGRFLVASATRRAFRKLSTTAQTATPATSSSPSSSSSAPSVSASTRPHQSPPSLSLRVALDDPRTILPEAFAARFDRFMASVSPTLRRLFALFVCVSDRSHDLRLQARNHKTGLLLNAELAFLPGRGTRDPARKLYLQALRSKYRNRLASSLADLRQMAARFPDSPYGRKSLRILEIRKAPPSLSLMTLASGVLLPALLRNRRAARTREAVVETARIGLRVATYFEKLAAKGKLAANRPGWGLEDTPVSPGRRCCALPDGQCPGGGSGHFRHPTWRKIGYSMTGPHRFRYRIQTSRTRTTLTVHIKAFGDLNCNRVESVLTRRIRIRTNGEVATAGPPTWLRNME